jgi:hypothetical protein
MPKRTNPALSASQIARDAAIELQAREGKRSFIVTVVQEKKFRVWASDSAKAEDEVYWMRSSGRPFPAVEPLGTSERVVVSD